MVSSKEINYLASTAIKKLSARPVIQNYTIYLKVIRPVENVITPLVPSGAIKLHKYNSLWRAANSKPNALGLYQIDLTALKYERQD